MGFERFVGLTVKDEKGYQAYREAMLPLLARHHGRFRYDFAVSKTLQSEKDREINRVFVIAFPGRAERDAFFSDPAYQAIRAKYYDPSVKTATVIAEYETP